LVTGDARDNAAHAKSCHKTPEKHCWDPAQVKTAVAEMDLLQMHRETFCERQEATELSADQGIKQLNDPWT
jgi:hypothetical protein